MTIKGERREDERRRSKLSLDSGSGIKSQRRREEAKRARSNPSPVSAFALVCVAQP